MTSTSKKTRRQRLRKLPRKIRREKPIEFPAEFGACFDTVAIAYIDFPPRARLCHGLGIANAPGQEGNKIAHAWIELDLMAYDTTWQAVVPADKYREDLQVSYVVEYSQFEAMEHWARTNMPGPWDYVIREHMKGKE